MTDPSVAELVRRITSLEARLKATERAGRLERASVLVDAMGTSLDVRQALLESNLTSYNLSQALLQIVAVDAGSIGTLSMYFGDLTPAGVLGDVWLKRDTAQLFQYIGGAWVLSLRQDLVPQFQAADVAVQTADGVIFTWWQPTEPPPGNFGDLWFKTDVANAAHRWDESQGWAPLVQAQLQSSNYVPGEAGFGFTPDGGGQVQTLQVIEQIGAALVVADDINLAGVGLLGRLANKPDGVVKLAYRGGESGATGAGPVSSTELRAFELNLGQLMAGHVYRTTASGHFQRTVADDAFDIRLRYTTDGSEATVTSPILPGGAHRLAFNQNYDFDVWTDIEPVATANYRIALTLQRAVGTGTGTIYLTEAARRFRWLTEDLGLTEGSLDIAALSQKLKADGSGADNPPVSTYSKTFLPTWIQSVDEFGQPLEGSSGTSPNMWQGFDTQNPETDHNDPGNYHRFTYIGFNSTQIQTALNQATSFVSCKLAWKVKARRSQQYGLDTRLLTHKYASNPGAGGAFVSAPKDDPTNVTRYPSVGVNNGANGSAYSADLGATVAAAFKAGTWKGCGLYGPTNLDESYGYSYGWGAGSSAPSLTIVYKGTS